MPIRKKENRKGGMHLKRRPALYLCRAVAIWICGIAGVWPAFAQRNMQDIIERPNNSKFNIGVKAGFNASMFLVSDFKIQDVTIDEIQNNYSRLFRRAFHAHQYEEALHTARSILQRQ